MKESCYKIHRYPTNNKKDDKGKQAEAHVATIEPHIGKGFTTNQMKILQEMFAGKSNSSGMIFHKNANHINHVDIFKNELHWILNFETSNHISGAKSLFQNLREGDEGHFVRISNGKTYHVKYVGEIQISPTLKLHNIFYIPLLEVNLISIAKLTKLNKYEVIFDSDFCHI